MALIDTATAKLHLRVDHTAEDSLLALWISVAEQQVAAFLNRNIYADQAALDAAVLVAPVTLAAASVAYESAYLSALGLQSVVERDTAGRYAADAYAKVRAEIDRIRRGIVVNDTIKAAILLVVTSLYEHRGEEGEQPGLPRAARDLLYPYREGMGV